MIGAVEALNLAMVGTLLTLVAVTAAAVAVWRSAAVKASLDVMRTINDELRASNDALRAELVDERERRAHLEGRLDALTSDLAERIIAAVTHLLAERNARTRKDDPR